MIGIYKITSPSGKIYIGQSINIQNRWITYQKYTYNCKSQIKLYNSFKKYSVENHIFEIIEECVLEDLNKREEFWKYYYNSVKKGLNHSYTDYSPMKGRKHTDEAINKIKNTHLGSKRSEETKLKMSNNSGIKGKPRGEYQKLRTSQANKGRKHTEEVCKRKRKIVLQYDLEGNFIREWNSITEAEDTLKIKGISYSCRNKIESGKYQWEYKTENYPLFIEPYINNNWVSVLQYDLQGNFIKEWKSLSDAMIKVGKGIQHCCKNKQQTSCGFMWKYKTENYPLKINPYYKKKIPRSENFILRMSRPVIQYELNGGFIKEWQSMKEAEENTHISAYNISGCVRNKQKTAGGYIWKYKNLAK